MSALDGWIDVCRAGSWTDVSGRSVTLASADLDRIAAAYGSADPAPVVVGHPETDSPAWAWVDGLRRVGDRLQARLRDIAPAFRTAVEAGRYAGRSVALAGDRLVHLGFLGGAPPAVDGLSPTRFAAAPDRVIELAAADLDASDRWAWGAVRRVLRRLRDWVIERDGVEKADAMIGEHELDLIGDHMEASDTPARLAAPAAAATEATDTTEADDTTDTETTTGDGMSGATEAALAAAQERLAADRAAMEAERAALAAERAAHEAAAARAERLAAAESEVAGHVRAGRVLPAEGPRLAALLAALPDDAGDARIAFAAPGEGEVTETPRAALAGFLGGLPARVDYGERSPDGDAPADDARDPQSLAAAARRLMAADATGTLTIADAVRRVQAGESAGVEARR